MKCNFVVIVISKIVYYVGIMERVLNEDVLFCVIKRGIFKLDIFWVLYLVDWLDKLIEERFVLVIIIGSCWLVVL